MADVLERDGGFCSGGEEDEMDGEDEIHSPTDASEDSVDVKVRAITFRNRNKRKCAEPRKLDSDLPAKKRKIDLKMVAGEEEVDSSGRRNPFRPWSASPAVLPLSNFGPIDRLSNRIDTRGKCEFGQIQTRGFCRPFGVAAGRKNDAQGFQPPFQRFPPVRIASEPNQEEPLSLVSNKRRDGDGEEGEGAKERNWCADGVAEVRVKWLEPRRDGENARNAIRGRANGFKSAGRGKTKSEKKRKRGEDEEEEAAEEEDEEEEDGREEDAVSHRSENKFGIENLLSSARSDGNSIPSTSKSSQAVHQQRNYKNMTRERRIEANARERTRVHTISAAFDTLRHSIPAYSHNQKLSKLSVLRIACSYIVTLSRLAGRDYSREGTRPDLSDCVENVSKTIQTEGKIRKKRED